MLTVETWVQSLLCVQPRPHSRAMEVQSPLLPQASPRWGRLSAEGAVWGKGCTEMGSPELVLEGRLGDG